MNSKHASTHTLIMAMREMTIAMMDREMTIETVVSVNVIDTLLTACTDSVVEVSFDVVVYESFVVGGAVFLSFVTVGGALSVVVGGATVSVPDVVRGVSMVLVGGGTD